MLVALGRQRADMGQVRPNSAKLHRNRPNLGGGWKHLGRASAKFDRSWAEIGDLGATPAEFTPDRPWSQRVSGRVVTAGPQVDLAATKSRRCTMDRNRPMWGALRAEFGRVCCLLAAVRAYLRRVWGLLAAVRASGAVATTRCQSYSSANPANGAHAAQGVRLGPCDGAASRPTAMPCRSRSARTPRRAVV